MISIMLPMQAVPKGRPRFDRRGIARSPEETRIFERDVARYLRSKYFGPALQGPLKLSVTFVFKRPKSQGTPKNKLWRAYPEYKPDLTNLEKAIEDAANGILWADDGQIVGKVSWKIYGDQPHITLTVTEVLDPK